MHKIVEKEQLAPEIKKLVVEAPLVARKFKAGQFVVVRVHEKGERIPLTAAQINPESGTITLIVQEVGKTTLELGVLEVGDEILDVVGPLGQLSKAEKYGTVMVIAGGVGAAEILLDLELLKENGNQVITILGARTKELIILEEEISKRSDELLVCTDDGSYGIPGMVTDVLQQLLDEGRKPDHISAVGPLPMMRAVSELTKKYEIPTTVSLNTIMLDGTGMCGSCRVSVGGEIKFACVDGPAFDAHKLDFEEIMRRQARFMEEERISLERYRQMMGVTAVGSNKK